MVYEEEDISRNVIFALAANGLPAWASEVETAVIECDTISVSECAEETSAPETIATEQQFPKQELAEMIEETVAEISTENTETITEKKNFGIFPKKSL